MASQMAQNASRSFLESFRGTCVTGPLLTRAHMPTVSQGKFLIIEQVITLAHITQFLCNNSSKYVLTVRVSIIQSISNP